MKRRLSRSLTASTTRSSKKRYRSKKRWQPSPLPLHQDQEANLGWAAPPTRSGMVDKSRHSEIHPQSIAAKLAQSNSSHPYSCLIPPAQPIGPSGGRKSVCRLIDSSQPCLIHYLAR